MTANKIVYIINSLNVGGAQVGLSRFVNGIEKERFKVTIIALNGGQDEIIERIPPWVEILDLGGSLRQSVFQSRKILTAIYSADIIVGSLFHSVLTARAAGLLNRDARVLTWQHSEQFKSNRRKKLFQATSRMSDLTLADSESVSEMLISDLGLDQEHVHLVPIAGIDLNEFTMVDHEQKPKTVVGSVGQLSEAKNYSVLLDVAQQLEEAEIIFKIAGDGDLKEELLREVERKNLENVTFLGDIRDVPGFLSTVDIYFQPSKREGLCIAVLEAMAAGLPVVGSNVGGIGRNVVPGKGGLLCEPGDVVGLVSAIRLFATEPELRKKYGQYNRSVVASKHTQEILVKEFLFAINKSGCKAF